MREARSENSWMHNAPLLMRGDRKPRALMHSEDAKQRGISEGDGIAVRSPYGKIELPATLTDDIVVGTVAIPHGWGHNGKGGWRVANRVGGVNVNVRDGLAVRRADRGGALVTGPVGDRREAGDSNLHCGANGAKMAL
jgi:anaerobic selenocysteine-containing dehydrogenase